MYPATIVDPAVTPRSELQAMLNANAYRIADLLSQLEKSGAELRRLRARASRVRRGARKPSARSPRATSTSASQSPSSIIATSTPTPARGHWTQEEEQRFCSAMTEHGDTAYSAIAATVGTRTEKQVRDHAWRVRQKGRAAAATEFAALQIPLTPSPAAAAIAAPGAELVPSSTPIPTTTTTACTSTPRPTPLQEPAPMILPQAAICTPASVPAPMTIPIPSAVPMPMPIPTLRCGHEHTVPDSPPLSAVSDDLGLLQSEELGLDALWDVPWALDLSCSPVETDDGSGDFADRFLIT